MRWETLKESGEAVLHRLALLQVWCSGSPLPLCFRKRLSVELLLSKIPRPVCCATSLAGPSLSKRLQSSLFGYTGSLWYSLDFYPSQNCISGDTHSRLPPSIYQFFLRDVQQQTWSISAPLCSLYALCNWGSEHQRGRVLLQVQL